MKINKENLKKVFKNITRIDVKKWILKIISLFGSFSYSPPVWLTRVNQFFTKTFLGRWYESFVLWKRQNPDVYRKRFGIAVGVVLVVCGSIYGIKKYLDSRPRPNYVKVTVIAPYPTSPEIGTPDKLVIAFDRSAAKTSDLNKIIVEGVKIKPALEGAWRWETDSRLSFQLDANHKIDWPAGGKFKLEFRKDFFPDQVLLEDYDLEFETQPLKMSLTKQEFYIDPRNPQTKKVLVNLRFNYPINAEDFKKRISFELKKEGVNLISSKSQFQVTFNKYWNEAYLQSEVIPVAKENQKMLVKIDAGTLPQGSGLASLDYQNIQVEIPGLYEAFKIQGVAASFARNQKYEPEQIVVIRTSIQTQSEDVAQKLKLFLLPKDLPAQGAKDEIKNYSWVSASEVTDNIRKNLQEVKFTLIPSETQWSRVHTFKIQAETRRSLLVSIQKGLQGLGEYELRDTNESVIRLEDFPKELQIMSRGALLSLSGDLKIPLLARNVNQVKFKISRIIPEQVNHLLSQLGSDIQSPSLPYGFEDQVAEKFETTLNLKIESAQSTQYFSFDLAPYLNKSSAQRGIFLVEAQSWEAGKYSEGPTDKRLIMVTDLGLLVKDSAAKNSDVYVQNFKSGLPVDGAIVEVIGRNGMAVLKATTDGQGHASFPDLRDFKNEKYPVAFSVKKGMDQSFLPFKNYNQYLQYSRFDVGGVYTSESSEQLTSMIFSDRGIYRPGESAHLGLIVRPHVGHNKIKSIPLLWSVVNSRGQEILKENIFVDSSDLKSLEFKTEETAPTGTYDIRVFVIKKTKQNEYPELIGSLSVKVEEFQPDRLKMSTHLAQEKLTGWIKPGVIKSHVDLKNLFGTAAENRRVKGVMTLTPSQPYFKIYKDYVFTNLNKSDDQVFTEILNEEKTDSQGKAEFSLDISKYTAQLFSLRFESEGFENEGGRSVHAAASVLVSPLDYLLGAKADGDLLYLKKNSERNIHIIAIDSDLKKIPVMDVEVQTIEKKYVSVLTQQSDGSFKYQSVLKETPGETKAIKISASGLNYKVDTSKPGDYSLVFRTKQKQEILKMNFNVVGETNLSRSLEKNAELQLSLNKTDFRPGEEIELEIKAPYKGAGLISIEREGVYATKWFKTQNPSTTEKIKIPAGLEGNAYINVTFLRAIDSTEIFSSPLSYAVAPFSISLDEKRTTIKLEAPEKIKPGEKLKINYAANKKTDLILYAVDEGILQVAKYRLPDPLGFFFRKRALQVQTYQMLDLLLPEFSVVKSTQGPGGDQGFGAIGKNLNPFRSKKSKPVAFWSGVIHADVHPQSLSFDIPDYFNGNIKIMAVAASELGLGSSEIASLVRGDFIISPTVPTFVAPQDEFVVSVGVANQKEKSGAKAQVTLDTGSSEHFKITDGQKHNLEIPEGHELQASVKVKAQNKLGDGQLVFKASSGGTSASAKIEVSVRPAFPYSHTLAVGIIDKLPLEFVNTRSVHSEYAKSQITVSAIPMIVGQGLLNYLETYPYGCTEQVVSRAVPSLILRSRPDFILNPEKQKEYFKTALQILSSRQTPDGGFALYSPQYEGSHPMASLYALHYLIEARDKKLTVPTEILQRGQNFLESFRNHFKPASLGDHRRWAYSLYLLARLGVVNGASLGELKRALDSLYKDQWMKDPVALYLAGIYRLYRQDDVADKILRQQKIGTYKETDWEDYLDSVVRDSLLIYITAKHAPQLLNDVMRTEQLKFVLEPLSQGQYNTHSAAYLLLALDAMADVPESNQSLSLITVDQQLPKQKDQWMSVPRAGKPNVTWNLDLNHLKARIQGPQAGTLFYTYLLSGFDKADQAQELKQNLEVSKDFFNHEGTTVDQVKVGDEVEVSLKIRSTDQKVHRHVALVDLIPGGFELVLDPVKNNLENVSNTQDPNSADPVEPSMEGEGDGDLPPPDPSESGDEVSDGAWLEPWLQLLKWPVAQAQTIKSPLKISTRSILNPLSADFVDKRDDRVVVYTSATPELREISYRIKAVNQGTFIVPPAFAEGMYDRSKKYQGRSKMIRVVAP